MCHLCDTRRLCERIQRNIKNIDEGGSVSPPALSELLKAAFADLVRYHNASAASGAFLRSEVVAVEIVGGPSHPPTDPEKMN